MSFSRQDKVGWASKWGDPTPIVDSLTFWASSMSFVGGPLCVITVSTLASRSCDGGGEQLTAKKRIVPAQIVKNREAGLSAILIFRALSMQSIREMLINDGRQ